MPDDGSPNKSIDSRRVFISWSGDRSKVVAQALTEWLPLVLHYVEPWMSEASIEAGERWGVAVAKELEVSNFGIICVTRDNIASPWVLFEAGALTKSLEQSRVIPLLLDLDFKDISGPLAQFQAKKLERTGVGETIQSINNAANQPVPAARATQLFAALWPQLEQKVAEIPKPAGQAKPNRSNSEVMEELVAGVRALETRIRDMESSPKSSKGRRERFHPAVFEEMLFGFANPDDPAGLLLAASMVREEAPWVYELAMELYRAIRGCDLEAILVQAERLRQMGEIAMRSPITRQLSERDGYAVVLELPRMLAHYAERAAESLKSSPERRHVARKRLVTE